MESIFSPLHEKGLTTLKLRHDFRTGEFMFQAGKDFEPGLDFSRYNRDFSQTSILTRDNRCLGTQEVERMYEDAGLSGYFDKIKSLVQEGKHMGINFITNTRLGINYVCGIHSDVRGRNNKSYTTFAGATRRHAPGVPELDVIIDALNLSRAMSFKNIAAGLPYGGCKSCLHMDEFSITDMDVMGFLAYVCDTSRCITGPDMNMPKEMVKVINEHFTMQYCGGPGSAMGDTANPTSLGTFLVLKQAVKFVTGDDGLKGMKVAVQGMGAVGYAMAEFLAREGCSLVVADPIAEKVERFIKEYPDADVSVVGLDEICFVEADVLSPNAMGRIIGEEEIPKIKAKYIIGSANNQLKATNQDEEIRLSKLLADKGILFQTEWWHNAAGVMAAAMEYVSGRDVTYTPADLEARVRDVIPKNTWQNLSRAKDLGVTPTESAYLMCQDIVYGRPHVCSEAAHL